MKGDPTTVAFDDWGALNCRAGWVVELPSGMTMQGDVIPATGTPYFTTNIEDGMALAMTIA